MSKPKLDPRPARKLTSRECARVLGGTLGGIATYVDLSLVREAVELFDTDDFWKVVSEARRSEMSSFLESQRVMDPGKRVMYRALGGTIASLTDLAGKKNARIAVRWWLKKDSWKFLEKAVSSSK